MTLNGSTKDDPQGPPGLRKLPERKESQCTVCSIKKKRRKARMVCSRCNRGLHGECFPKHRCRLQMFYKKCSTSGPDNSTDTKLISNYTEINVLSCRISDEE
ncbi:hypothetical protein L798_11275 [Zootermopsis nevadensis]|uniref:Uncharacterized protein n=1 Tax=Zootermopsis nevadensis TaxID=136037 RepID=A0A067QXA5_ZOONE|nr:hypothetical protein L798_11275 [Zootermopsis nevadensis]